jgi:hypothetical protein
MGSSTEEVVDTSQIVKIKGKPSDPNAEFGVLDFIAYVEALEAAASYSSFSKAEILTTIRQQYYPGSDPIYPKWDQLLPDAPNWIGTVSGSFRRLMSSPPIDGNAFKHLTAKADENGTQDNPSPYAIGPRRERIDIGHTLLGLDALIHPRVAHPYSTLGISNIDPASWIADLALAAYWTESHGDGAPKKWVGPAGSSGEFFVYYFMSAPDEDLFGDADSFGLYKLWNSVTKLSEALRRYYIGVPPATPLVWQRWQIFCQANNLAYTKSGVSISWASGVTAPWIPRIDRMCDLIKLGWTSAFALSAPPAPRAWKYSSSALDRFLDWVKMYLEPELRTP